MIEDLSVLLSSYGALMQWLNHRRSSNKMITPLQKKQLAHAAACALAFLDECEKCGIDAHADDSVIPQPGDEDEPEAQPHSKG